MMRWHHALCQDLGAMKVDIGRGLAKIDTASQKNTLPAYRSQGGVTISLTRYITRFLQYAANQTVDTNSA